MQIGEAWMARRSGEAGFSLYLAAGPRIAMGEQQPDEAGFSLLEVVLAVVLLVTMLLPVSALVSDTSVTVGNQRARAIADELAQKYLHEAQLWEATHQAFSMCDGATEVDGAATGCGVAHILLVNNGTKLVNETTNETTNGTSFYVQIVDSFCGGGSGGSGPTEPPVFEIGVKVWWGSATNPPPSKTVVLVGEVTTPPFIISQSFVCLASYI